MLKPLLGSESRERVLIFILARATGYATQIAAFYQTDLNQVQKQLDGLEAGAILVSRPVGRTRVYEFSPRYPFLKELKALLEKALSFYPEAQRERLIMVRRRPRRRGKPL